MLNRKEQIYFNRMKDYIVKLFNLKVPIYALDHKKFFPVEKGEELLGICHKMRDRSGNVTGYIITIDEPYIRACYCGRQLPYSPFSDSTLMETICHEIAHLTVWEHGSEHDELTRRLYQAALF